MTAIKNWSEVFAQDQIFIGYLEEMRKDPVELMGRICHHIGIDPSQFDGDNNLKEASHQGQAIPMEAKYRDYLKEQYFQQNEELFKMTGSQIVKSWNS